MVGQKEEYLKINGITKSYGVVKALTNVSMTIKKGEIHTILGENGAGKSTLVKIIMGEETPDAGSIILDDEQIRTYTPSAAQAMGIRMVHQELAVFENMTVAENIFPSHSFKKNGRIDYKELHQETQKQLEAFGMKTVKPEEQMAGVTLAGQQMLEIIRCIVANPKVIILDEPTSGLNDEEADRLMEILERLKADGMTIIYISHRLKEIMKISDRVTILRDGQYVTTLINDEKLTENDLINNMVGRDLHLYSLKNPEDVIKNEEVVFEVRNLSKLHALKPSELKLHRGEILGIFGLEGSGVTKLSRMMYGLERRDSGEIFVKGEKVNRITPKNMVDRHVMYLNNNRKVAGLLLDMPVTDNVSLPILGKVSNKLGFINNKELRRISTEYIKKFAIALPSLSTKPRKLSGGNQQKVMMSACLAPEPEVVIVNEPTRGIDVGAKEEIHKFLLEIAKNGVGVIVFSSELPELMRLSDRIKIMRDNAIAGEVECHEFTEQTIMKFATVGISREGGKAQ
ncbi:MAG: sugar ABC transporter ATP-binding protein [Lachnospiraceae bacterium]|nr:sugar ABC transporter ATP-binding protein [Lachnospiraceae bacterium]